jgi:hypothetical protein
MKVKRESIRILRGTFFEGWSSFSGTSRLFGVFLSKKSHPNRNGQSWWDP